MGCVAIRGGPRLAGSRLSSARFVASSIDTTGAPQRERRLPSRLAVGSAASASAAAALAGCLAASSAGVDAVGAGAGTAAVICADGCAAAVDALALEEAAVCSRDGVTALVALALASFDADEDVALGGDGAFFFSGASIGRGDDTRLALAAVSTSCRTVASTMGGRVVDWRQKIGKKECASV